LQQLQKRQKKQKVKHILKGRAAALPQTVEKVKQKCLTFFIDMWYKKYGDEMC